MLNGKGSRDTATEWIQKWKHERWRFFRMDSNIAALLTVGNRGDKARHCREE